MSLNVRLLIALFSVLILTIIPMPSLVSVARPPWILILVLCVQFFFPAYFHLVSIIILGLCMDVLLTTITGEHSFALLLTTWLSSGKVRRFRFYTIGQQMALVGVYLGIYECTLFIIDAFLGCQVELKIAFCATLSGVILWPWIVLLAESALRGRSQRYARSRI